MTQYVCYKAKYGHRAARSAERCETVSKFCLVSPPYHQACVALSSSSALAPGSSAFACRLGGGGFPLPPSAEGGSSGLLRPSRVTMALVTAARGPPIRKLREKKKRELHDQGLEREWEGTRHTATGTGMSRACTSCVCASGALLTC